MEQIVAQDNFLTPTARHADIVLLATTFWERNDVHMPWAGAGYCAIYMKQQIIMKQGDYGLAASRVT